MRAQEAKGNRQVHVSCNITNVQPRIWLHQSPTFSIQPPHRHSQRIKPQCREPRTRSYPKRPRNQVFLHPIQVTIAIPILLPGPDDTSQGYLATRVFPRTTSVWSSKDYRVSTSFEQTQCSIRVSRLVVNVQDVDESVEKMRDSTSCRNSQC